MHVIVSQCRGEFRVFLVIHSTSEGDLLRAIDGPEAHEVLNKWLRARAIAMPSVHQKGTNTGGTTTRCDSVTIVRPSRLRGQTVPCSSGPLAVGLRKATACRASFLELRFLYRNRQVKSWKGTRSTQYRALAHSGPLAFG